MTERNGSTESPTSVVARSFAELAHDVATMAELQAELFKLEFQQARRDMVMPLLLFTAAAVVALGCVPVLLLSLAYALVELAGLSQALSLLIAALVGLAGVAVAAGLGWRKLKHGSMTWERSREEFSRNVAWIKLVLKHKARPAGGECRPRMSSASSRGTRGA